jgi:hypothetical protein
VQAKHGRVRPLGSAKEEISFSAWRMAHALKKADCAREASPALLAAGAAGFLLEHVYLFDWQHDGLRLNAGMSDFYADITRASLAGRVAQGIALLFLESQGYAYTSRLSAEIKRQNGMARAQGHLKSKIKKSGAAQSRVPDFLVENDKGERALAESKGAFVPPNEHCNIKGALNDALEQLDGWDRVLLPQPLKSFAIGTFLRESDDVFEEPSLIAFVDPQPGQPDRPIEVPPDAIRRSNYASWLALMGFSDAAQRLRTRAGDLQQRTVPLIRLGGRPYVVSIISIRPRAAEDRRETEFWHDIDDWPYLFWGPFSDGICLELVGLDLDVVRALGQASDHSIGQGLMALEPYERHDIPSEVDGGRFYGSVFSDGSLLGELRIARSSRLRLEEVGVKL